jgi:arylsulfatase
MAVHAAMVDRMDQGIGRVLDTLKRQGVDRNTLVLFLSDNGASAEALDSWPNPARGHRPGTPVGAPGSHRCLEVGWANAANTPFREHKMWVHEGGISTPLVMRWPKGDLPHGRLVRAPSHLIDLMPTFLDLAGAIYPARMGDHELTPLPGRSLLPLLAGRSPRVRTLGWEHEGNRAVRVGDWKLVSTFQGQWELYDLRTDRTEMHDRYASEPARARELLDAWERWSKDVGVAPWEKLPGAQYRPTPQYRKRSEPPVPAEPEPEKGGGSQTRTQQAADLSL